MRHDEPITVLVLKNVLGEWEIANSEQPEYRWTGKRWVTAYHHVSVLTFSSALDACRYSTANHLWPIRLGVCTLWEWRPLVS